MVNWGETKEFSINYPQTRAGWGHIKLFVPNLENQKYGQIFFCFVPLSSIRIWEFPSYLMDFSYFGLKHIPSDFIKFQVTSWNVYFRNIFSKTKTFQGKTTGQDLLDEIFKYINIIERAYFGLRYQDNDNQTVITRYNTNKNSSLALTCCCTASRNNWGGLFPNYRPRANCNLNWFLWKV